MPPTTNESPTSLQTIRRPISASPTTWEFVEAAQAYAISRARCGSPTTEIRLRLTDRGVPPRVAWGLADVARRAGQPGSPDRPRPWTWAGWLLAGCVATAGTAWTAMTGWWLLPLAVTAATLLFLPAHSGNPTDDQPLPEIRRRTS